MNENQKFSSGDLVRINCPGVAMDKKAKIVGHSKSGVCCWVVRDGNSEKTKELFHIKFIERRVQSE